MQVKFLGTYTFTPEKVIRVAPFGLIPFVGKESAFSIVSRATQIKLYFGTYVQTHGPSSLRSQLTAMAPNHSFKADGFAAA